MKTLLLSQSDVRAVLSMDRAVSAVQKAFLAHGRGETLMPPKVYLPLPQHHGDFRAMPAYVAGAAGVKWVNSHPENPKRHGLPSVLAVYVLSDPETAMPLAIMDGTLLTAVRTGAAAAVASQLLARPAPRTIGFIGTGVQARFLLEAHCVVYPQGFDILVADISDEAARAFAAEVGGKQVTVEQAAGCDIVCTATPSRAPVVRRAWVRQGAHINALGADAPGKQELDPQILFDAKVVIDDWEQATESGEVNVSLHDGSYRRERIHATLGEVLAKKKPAREGDEITVFDSTGLAVQDSGPGQVDPPNGQGTRPWHPLRPNRQRMSSGFGPQWHVLNGVPMDILFVATELAPIVKVGGLADVVAALTKTLRQLGHKVTLAMPRFPALERGGLLVARRLTPLSFNLGGSPGRGYGLRR